MKLWVSVPSTVVTELVKYKLTLTNYHDALKVLVGNGLMYGT